MRRRRRRREPRRCKYDNNKVIFRDWLDAEIALARKGRDNNNKEKVPQRAYKCTLSPPDVHHWHLTSEKERNMRPETGVLRMREVGGNTKRNKPCRNKSRRLTAKEVRALGVSSVGYKDRISLALDNAARSE
jgi:hypothetical protein